MTTNTITNTIIMRRNNEVQERKCPKCGYKWTPRIKKPKACPECKTRLNNKKGSR